MVCDEETERGVIITKDAETDKEYRTRVRRYNDDDNREMQVMEKACVQGDPEQLTWYAVFDDFTSRAKKYTHYHILVLEDTLAKRAIGTASVGIKRVNWFDAESKPCVELVGHAFNLRLHPDYRGKRLTRPMVEERKRLAYESGCTHVYATIATNNTPSLSLFRPSVTFAVDCFACPLSRNQDEIDPARLSNETLCQRLDHEEAVALVTKHHGSKLFFPQDMPSLLSHKHCLGTWLANDSTAESFAFFCLWDSSASFKWQLTEKGKELPLQSIANIFGLTVVGKRGLDCLERLLEVVIKSSTLEKHQRLHCFIPPDTLSQQLQKHDGALKHTAVLSLVITPTTGIASEDTRFNEVTSENLFCDPRDY